MILNNPHDGDDFSRALRKKILYQFQLVQIYSNLSIIERLVVLPCGQLR